MHLHSEIQGSPEWAALRSRYYTASNAAAMKGCHPTKQRNELLRETKTGIVADVSDFVEVRVFAPGHATESAARPLAEVEIGEDLYPVVGSLEVEGLPLLASFDGLTMDYSIGYEHKLYSEEIASHIAQVGEPPLYYVWQLEQQLLVSGGQRILFVTSDGTPGKWAQCWYTSKPERRAALIAGWKQFAKDLIEFTPTAAEVKPTGKAPETLPALHIVIQGGVSASNLDEFKETALGAIRSVNRELTTDVHFADAEKAVKWCSDIEDRIKAAKDHALSQTASIDALFRTMDEISAEARRVRLDLDKLVKARKESMKADIVASGVAAMAKHIRELNAAMPANYMPQVPDDFGGAIKGLRTIDSITNAVDTELARVKIAANDIANRIHSNLAALRDAGIGIPPDLATLVVKATDDFAAVIAQRVAVAKAAEEAQRERIRAEEAARLEREAEAARKVREAAEEMARKREQEEAGRLERERANAVQVEADRIAREQAEAVSAARIREEQAEISQQGADALAYAIQSPAVQDTLNTTIDKMATAAVVSRGYRPISFGVDLASKPDIGTPEDDGARLTLTQLNAAIAPVSINVAGLSALGFDPVEQVKASRFYRECDLPAICRAISAHVLAACAVEAVE
ncbi:MAG TPA: Heme peroxidase [Hydrogenophaga sp.]|uniref:YqaJ viral recombinase family protein n=1 Tax=Hydrogenophaga sp. TaxID=1904254 RepID=UPI0008C50BA7|nr:YqaJ viral recombinase family protein [Hydrogenophaga sp.]OGA78800.1 MAG: hypothetical protein A2X73_07560 [Burkholderiales bacterium GWE1_65_30]OGA89372.1 MAG: hypothetical protein A2X72_16725 [Burkholderiales bacterium GWF1_66_17]HAX23087.1 Heme peroxidase [Hydrogenophaga sp.]HBU17048.1 Heme peroxidase [Hydrogenophaga sp.]